MSLIMCHRGKAAGNYFPSLPNVKVHWREMESKITANLLAFTIYKTAHLQRGKTYHKLLGHLWSEWKQKYEVGIIQWSVFIIRCDIYSSHFLSCSKKTDGVQTDIMLQFKQKQQRDWDTYEQWPEVKHTYVTQLWDAEQTHYRSMDKFPKDLFTYPCHWADSDKSSFTYPWTNFVKPMDLSDMKTMFCHWRTYEYLYKNRKKKKKRKTPNPLYPQAHTKGMLVHPI